MAMTVTNSVSTQEKLLRAREAAGEAGFALDGRKERVVAGDRRCD